MLAMSPKNLQQHPVLLPKLLLDLILVTPAFILRNHYSFLAAKGLCLTPLHETLTLRIRLCFLKPVHFA